MPQHRYVQEGPGENRRKDSGKDELRGQGRDDGHDVPNDEGLRTANDHGHDAPLCGYDRSEGAQGEAKRVCGENVRHLDRTGDGGHVREREEGVCDKGG